MDEVRHISSPLVSPVAEPARMSSCKFVISHDSDSYGRNECHGI